MIPMCRRYGHSKESILSRNSQMFVTNCNRYPIPTGGDLLNFIALSSGHKRPPNSDSREFKMSQSELFSLYEGWAPIIQKLIGLINEPECFPIYEWLPIENWVFEGGRVVLMGDAAHVRHQEMISDYRLCFLIMARAHHNPSKTVIVSRVV
jgi:hypothetical protein